MTLEIQRAKNVTEARRDGGKRRAENVTCERKECAGKEFKIDANDVAKNVPRDCT